VTRCRMLCGVKSKQRDELAINVGAEQCMLASDAQVIVVLGTTKEGRRGGDRERGHDNGACAVSTCFGHEGVD
jgi:hypothetical protein